MIALKFETEIKGTCQVDKHQNWIVVDALEFGVGRAIDSIGGGKDRGTNNPSFSEMAFKKSTDISSADLYFQAVAGKSLGNAEIHFIQTSGTDGKGQVYLTIELDEPIVSAYSTSSGGDRPTESFTLNFTKISYQYNAFDGDKIKTGTAKKWNIAENEPY
ncbi:MAG: Hcp family type VI secretion system effector [Gammaproteobacteria bacterium]